MCRKLSKIGQKSFKVNLVKYHPNLINLGPDYLNKCTTDAISRWIVVGFLNGIVIESLLYSISQMEVISNCQKKIRIWGQIVEVSLLQ